MASLFCGGTALTVNLFTDYQDNGRKLINLRLHRHLDFGLAAMTALMPEVLWFNEDAEKRFFVAQGAVMTAVNQVTRFPKGPDVPEKHRVRRRVA